MTQIPARLPERAYLIAYDVEKKKMAPGSNHAELVRAATLVELFLDGRLVDDDGKVSVCGQRPDNRTDDRPDNRTDDGLLDAVLDQISASKPRSWKHWAKKNHQATYEAVRERLAADRMIKVEDARLLGIIPKKNVTVRDTRVVRELVADSRRAVLGGVPVAQLDDREAALAALVAAVELNTVFSGQERRAHRDKIAQLAVRAGPAAAALRRLVQDKQAAVATAGG
jgi:hypothetical protein